MRKWIRYLLAITLIFSHTSISLFASYSEEDKERIRQEFNDDMVTIYGEDENYYPLSCQHGELDIYIKNQIRGGGEAWSNILAYGTPYGTPLDAGAHEFLGRTKYGVGVPNPQYGWVGGWDGIVISKWGKKEPWNSGYCKRSKYDVKEFTVPGIGSTTLEQAIQKGVDLVYGGKKFNDVKGSKTTPRPIEYAVHNVGDAPNEGWTKYVNVVIPPTQKTWGQGYLRKSSSYMGIPIAPFNLIEADLTVEMECSQTAGVRNEDLVTASVTVNSTFKEAQETDYMWIIKGNTTGKTYHTDLAVKCVFSGYGSQESKGEVVIPSKGEALDAVFDLTFEMPKEPVTITFEINTKTPKSPEESSYKNNKVSVVIPWVRYDITRADYTLDYNELTKEIGHELAGGGIGGSVKEPTENRAEWDGNMTGSLSVEIQDDNNALTGTRVRDETNEPVDEDSSSVTRSPIIDGVIDRSGYGDFYLPNNSNPLVRKMDILYEGDLQRPYKYHTSHSVFDYTDEDGVNHYRTCDGCSRRNGSGTARGTFQAGEDKLKIQVLVYNGMKNMPQVAARNFLKRIDYNTTSSLNKTIWWESDEYIMAVQRWMANIYRESDTEWLPIEGQYDRVFTQQNKATIKWGIKRSMGQAYAGDRNNARNRVTRKSAYPRVPFATDRDLQLYDYPFKSGYYFNPAGEYTFTVKTEIFKDEIGETYEHKELVDQLIGSFRYGSNMTYLDNGIPDQLILQINDPTKDQPEDKLLDVERDYYYVKDDEIPYSPYSSGYTHRYFKEILEGYSESNTNSSKDDFKYREYIQDGQSIYRITEETTITIKVNQYNQPQYTYGGMKNGTYYMTSWVEDVDISYITNVPNMNLKGINNTATLDEIRINVQGSMYDDLNN